ncbi:acyltransferase [Cellulophaga tyrosinoxydans]|uniref:Acetyltransferase (Isoleucine patch superfamily) n=1 Tax=Cellulophaga tyrosinoxydans TaxID=504486 RepID=A0A1W2AQ60_9FLAO|nr:acyltransferase [Cellulophaga tyrosinoxydans]SMC62869.1 Acetyltransferase (isoleucine patch superfamily) [Cellulophaga tyrosinoxydans]
MKQKIKKFIKGHPLLLKYTRIILNPGKKLPSFKKIMKGKNNTLNISSSAILRSCIIEITGNGNKVFIEESVILNNVKLYIIGDKNKIHISKNVWFNRGGVIWIEDCNCSALIGQNCKFEDVHIAVTEPNSKITIGDDCLFAYDIDIRTGDSHSIIDTKSNKRINFAKDVCIGNHVWVASHVSILKGVNIAANTVIATRSTVTKSFDRENILIGGSPSKILKEDINWDINRLTQ